MNTWECGGGGAYDEVDHPAQKVPSFFQFVYNEMENVTSSSQRSDQYTHIDNSVTYIYENMPSTGCDLDVVCEMLDVKCGCDSTCDETCHCVFGQGVNYINGLLVDEKLVNDRCILECNINCGCGLSCGNSVVQSGPNSGLYVREVENKGFGLFSKGKLAKGSFICEYAGEIISKEEARLRFDIGNHKKYIFCLKEHCYKLVIETYIDATRFGNIGRYANHSCLPNCIVLPVRTGYVVPKLAMFAQCTIYPNEEITYSYDLVGSGLSTSRCFCRSSVCRKFIPGTGSTSM